MERDPQPQTPSPSGEAEREARRVLEEFERDSLARRRVLASRVNQPVIRVIGLLVILGLGLGAVFLLLYTASTLPDLLGQPR